MSSQETDGDRTPPDPAPNHEILALIERLRDCAINSAERRELVEEVCRLVYPLVVMWASRRRLQLADQVDVVQNVMIGLIRYIYGDRIDNLSSFIFSLVRNRTNDFFRKLEVRRRRLGRQHPLDGLQSDEDDGPIDILIRDENRRVVRSAIDQLPPNDREILRLQFFEEMSYEDIADCIGIPIGTVRSRLHAARQRLCESLRRAGFVGPGPSPPE